VPLNSVGKIGFVGGGNMAEAFVKGLLNGNFTAEDIYFFEPHEPRRTTMVERYGITSAADNKALVSACDVVVLAIKPQIVERVVSDFAPEWNPEALLISILAGVTTEALESMIGKKAHVIRAMPNTPALVDEAASALCPGSQVDAQHRELAQQLFETVGTVVWVDENQMDAVTGLSGSGPAFVYTFIEALTAGGVQEGLRLDVAHSLAVQTVFGAARLVKESGEHPALLREKVCSPGGTTISAIRVLEERGLRATLMEAVGSATKRSKELGEK